MGGGACLEVGGRWRERLIEIYGAVILFSGGGGGGSGDGFCVCAWGETVDY